MDGTVVGYEAGPRAMKWKDSGLILASTDEVALDSVASKIIGVNPKKTKYLKLGKSLALGENNLNRIEIVGIKKLPNFRLKTKQNMVSMGQNFIYKKMPFWFEKLLLQTIIAPWSYLASKIFYDGYWYHFVGKLRVKRYMFSKWGRLLKSYLSTSFLND